MRPAPVRPWSAKPGVSTSVQHVYPLAEERDHDLTGEEECWCLPTVEHDQSGRPALVVHRRTDVA